MNKQEILENLFDKKVVRILKLFINNPESEYYLREIAKITKVSPATTYRILNSMTQMKLLEEKKTKHLKTYTINKENSKMFFDLLQDRRTAIQEFVENVSDMDGVKQIIQHGKEEKNRTSILVVGEDVDQDKIRKVVVSIKENLDFMIVHLVLSEDQYEQMLSMGLYPGTKSTLYTSK